MIPADFLPILKSGEKMVYSLVPDREELTERKKLKKEKKSLVLYQQAILFICLAILGWLVFLTFSGMEYLFSAVLCHLSHFQDTTVKRKTMTRTFKKD